MTTKELLKNYYDGLSKKDGWESTITDDFTFKGIGGLTSKAQGTKGKNAYIETIKRFYLVFESATIKDMLVDSNNAYVTANYNLVSAKGKKLNFDIAEIWTIKNSKLDSLIIYFDTATWNDFFSK